MQEHRAAAAGDTRGAVVIDLDNEIVEMIVALEPVAGLTLSAPHRLIVMPVVRVLAPGVLGPDRAGRQEGLRPGMPVGAPPQLPGPECALGRAAVAFALVGPDAAAPKCHRHGPAIGRQPAPAGVAGGPVNPYRRERPITWFCLISD